MGEMVTIPKAEYERLRGLEEDFRDIRAALEVEDRIRRGEEECVPASLVERLLAGVVPLRVWREHRALTQAELARRAGVSRVQIVDIEAGRKAGSVFTLRKLADALGIALDDLVPSPD